MPVSDPLDDLGDLLKEAGDSLGLSLRLEILVAAIYEI